MWSKIKSYFSDVGFAFRTSFRVAPVLHISYIIVMALVAFFPFIASRVLARIIDTLINELGKPGFVISTISTLAIIYASVEVLRQVFQIIDRYFDRVIRNKSQLFMEKLYIEKKCSIDIGTLEDKTYQDLESRALSQGLWPIINIYTSNIELITPIISIIIALTLVGTLDIKMLLIILAGSIPLAMAQKNYGKSNYNIWNSEGGTIRRKYSNYKQHIVFNKYLIESRLYKSVKFFFNNTIKIFADKTDQSKKAITVYHKDLIITEIVSGVSTLAIIVLLINHIIDGAITIGLFSFYLTTMGRLEGGVADITRGLTGQSENLLALKDIREWLAVESQIKTPNQVNLNLIDPSIAPKIEFRNVSFKYPNGTDYVLKNISFTLNPGDKLGLVGENGAGKTTLIKLLLRYYDPTEGDIFINNINLKNIEPDNWYEYVIALMQDYSSYSLITKEAIAISDINKDIDENWVKEAAKRSSAHEIIDKWEGKYNQQIGRHFGGTSLSTGQSQKFALARTFYKKAPVIILDEPTAAIDMKSEIEIFNSLSLLPTTSIVIYISHDMSTIMKANIIFVLDKDGIIERGNHQELMALKGQYAHLYSEQVKSLGM